MIYGGSNTTGHPTVGGWQLGINAFSSSEKQNAAWKFIQFMVSLESQKELAIKTSVSVTHAGVYDDPEVQAKAPLLSRLKANLQLAYPRPVSSAYADITQAIQVQIHKALAKQISPTDALSTLQSDLEKIVSQ
jgi:multiple sugar transport system substrate-binding protein